MPNATSIKRKTSRIAKKPKVFKSTGKEKVIKNFVDEFYLKYGKMMSRLSHE